VSWTLAVSREFLERALSQARSRELYHDLGERVCNVMELEELEEQRMLRTPGSSIEADGTPRPTNAQARRLRQMDRALKRNR
jgi:hypothetical protein